MPQFRDEIMDIALKLAAQRERVAAISKNTDINEHTALLYVNAFKMKKTEQMQVAEKFLFL